MSEMSEIVRRESAPELLWKPDCVNENGMSSNSRILMPSDKDNRYQKSENSIDINGNYTDKFCDENEKFSEDQENFTRFVGSGNYGGNCSDLCKGNCGNDCRNGDCKSSMDSAAKRRNSTSDLNFRGSDLFTNATSIPLRRSSILGGSVKSMEKMDKINLANLVFNPNFKNSAGCVNLPVIRAGQNLAQKNAQRSSLASAKDALKEDVQSPKDFNLMTQQAALDLLALQLQPHSLDKLTQKLQLLSNQRKSKAGGNADAEDPAAASLAGGLGSSDEIIQTFTAKSQQAQQQQPLGNALRYKTELCRSYEEGGECRFGSACTFAHGAEELRPVPRHPLYKTELCRTYHQHGYCQYGTRCHFIHDADEADKNAPLKGCKSWGRHDQLSGALLSLASSSGLLDSAGAAQQTASSSDNDVLLANLRRLYALRVMNGQDKTADQNTQFSMSQPMSHQLSMAHQQLASAGFSGTQNMPLSMTQPLPMDALHVGLQRAGQVHPYHQRASGQLYPHMATNNRLESLANDYGGWGVAPPSPTYSGVSPFGNYHQQFSPLPHHQTSSSGYPSHQYSFSATAPDLSAALNMVSPYSMSPQSFSNTVNVGHYLQDPSANYAAAAAASAKYHTNTTTSTSSQGASGSSGQGVYVSGPNPVWPQTSAEVSSAIDNELFGFGLDSQQNSGSKSGSASGYPLPSHQQYQHPYFQSMAAYQQQLPQQQYGGSQLPYPDQSKYAYQGASSSHNERTAETELLNLLHGGHSDKYASGKESRTLGTINESSDGSDQSVRPKNRTRTSLGNAKLD